MRHRRPRTDRKEILLCPQCRSPEIVYEAGLITGQVYRCQKCDYVGSLVLAIDVARDGTPPADPA